MRSLWLCRVFCNYLISGTILGKITFTECVFITAMYPRICQYALLRSRIDVLCVDYLSISLQVPILPPPAHFPTFLSISLAIRFVVTAFATIRDFAQVNTDQAGPEQRIK
jgi:hypothetical protein